MEQSRLPIELCERVIDCVRQTQQWWDRHQLVHRTPVYTGSRKPLLDFLACAWTCSAWYPRARLQLYHTIVFSYPHQVQLFIRSIHENPSLADLVRELIIHLGGGYIPFAQSTLWGALKRLHTVVLPLLQVHNWRYPPRHHILVTQFPLTDLIFDLNASDHSTLFYAFRLIWSLRELQSLTLMFVGGAPVFTDSLVRRLRSLRRAWSCGKLKVLTITGVFLQKAMTVLPSCPFGVAVEQLAVYLDEQPSWTRSSADDATSGALMEQLSLFVSLRHLRIWAHIQPNNLESISVALPMVLRALLSPKALVALTIMVQNNGGAPASWSAFVSSLSASKVDEILRRFPNLGVLYFEFTEMKVGNRNSAWWEEKLLDHMPALRGVLTIKAKITRYALVHAWSEDYPERRFEQKGSQASGGEGLTLPYRSPRRLRPQPRRLTAKPNDSEPL